MIKTFKGRIRTSKKITIRSRARSTEREEREERERERAEPLVAIIITCKNIPTRYSLTQRERERERERPGDCYPISMLKRNTHKDSRARISGRVKFHHPPRMLGCVETLTHATAALVLSVATEIFPIFQQTNKSQLFVD